MNRFQLWAFLAGMLLVAASAVLRLLDGGGYLIGPVGNVILLVLAIAGAVVAAVQLWRQRAQAARSRSTSSR